MASRGLRLRQALREDLGCGDRRGPKTQRIVLWNAVAAKMFGYSASEALKLRVEELVPEPLEAAHRAGITRYAKTGHGQYIDSDVPVDLPAMRKNSKQIDVELSLSPIRSVHNADDDEAQFMLAIIREVTERKRAEEAVRKLLKDLENRVQERTSQLEATIAELQSNQQQLRQSEEPSGFWLRASRTTRSLCSVQRGTQRKLERRGWAHTGLRGVGDRRRALLGFLRR